AALLGYLIVPLHRWLVRRGLSPLLSGVALLAGFVAAAYGLGMMLYQSFDDLSSQLPDYQRNLRFMLSDLVEHIPGVDAKTVERMLVGEARSAEENVRTLQSALGTFVGFASNVVIVLVYLVFLLVEHAGFERRIELAFGPVRARPILALVERIN